MDVEVRPVFGVCGHGRPALSQTLGEEKQSGRQASETRDKFRTALNSTAQDTSLQNLDRLRLHQTQSEATEANERKTHANSDKWLIGTKVLGLPWINTAPVGVLRQIGVVPPHLITPAHAKASMRLTCCRHRSPSSTA